MSAEFDSFSPKKRKEKKNELGNSNKRCKADVALDTLYRQKKNKLSDHTYSIYKTSVFLAAVYPFPIAIVKRSQIYFVLDFGSILRGKKKITSISMKYRDRALASADRNLTVVARQVLLVYTRI